MATMVLGWDVHLVRRMLGANDAGRSRPSTHIERDRAWSQILASLEAYPAVHAYLMCKQDSFFDFHDPLVIGAEITGGEATTPEVMWTHVTIDGQRPVAGLSILQQLQAWREGLEEEGRTLPEPSIHFSAWCAEAEHVERHVR